MSPKMSTSQLFLSALIFQLSLCLISVGAEVSDSLYRGDGELHNGGKIWALLVAGSNGYYNYRHQADVCHAYQILLKNSIPADNIIIMMYDDVARDSQNPTPNVILNHPDGPNVYKGIKIDYSSSAVTPSNFLAVLRGDEDAVKNVGSGRVIKSGPKDHVFVNFVDHGAPGFLQFPSGELHARDLENTLLQMNKSQLYSKMVLYVEACESGSMFETILPDDLNIFAMTASDPRESSYACYYDNLRGTYLGDVFSVRWMEDSDIENLSKETLHHQFAVVRRETNTSHVEEYGDLNIGSLPVASFQGYSNQSDGNALQRRPSATWDAVASHHVPLAILKRKLASATDKETVDELKFEIHRVTKMRHFLEKTVAGIADHVSQQNGKKKEELLKKHHKLTSSNLDCYENIVKRFSTKCFKLSKNPYATSQMYVFINMCSETWVNLKAVYDGMDLICINTERLTGII